MAVHDVPRASEPPEPAATDIAIVGMALRVPGASDVRRFWSNVRGKVESIRRYSEDELRAAGVDEALLRNPNYVRAGGALDGIDQFDASFFGFGPRDAAIMDPQHRHFLECCWEALEDAAIPPAAFPGQIGVFAGCGMGAYFVWNVLTHPELLDSVGLFLLRHTGNDKDFLPTRVSYCLNLRGPSVAVQTACSTSLVAVHLACQSLIAMECDLALAGGVTIELPAGHGYLFKENEVLAPDGHCRAFATGARGTVLTSGAGVVALRRLADAVRDGDPIHAVLKATAINNDGAGKVGYLAPSVDGHAAVVAEALALSGIDPRSIGLFEAHGTGTQVGDPIEITALTQAWRAHTRDSGFCALGSVKTNIGHLDTAAGVVGLIKAARAVAAGELPPSLHFDQPNPLIDFPSTPFYVNTELRPWPAERGPRRAAVSSLGVGGTNAHAIVEAPPAPRPVPAGAEWQLLLFSGKSARAADGNVHRLRQHLAAEPGLDLADVAYTLEAGRQPFEHRRAVPARDRAHALEVLASNDARYVAHGTAADRPPALVFMFPGGGAQYPGMGRGLYARYPVYARAIDGCLELLEPEVRAGVRELLFVQPGEPPLADEQVQHPVRALPALFATEYALAQLLMDWGLQPDALTGHSLGEYTAACLAGVMSLADALQLLVLRARLQASVPAGGMLSVPLPEAELQSLLDGELSLAASNAPELCVVSGPEHAVAALAAVLEARGVESRRLRIAVPGHSAVLDPVLDEFRAGARRLRLARPLRRFVSNLSGTWADPEEVATPEYWVRHLRNTVRFGDGLATVMGEGHSVLLEVGPGTTLAALARMQRSKRAGHEIASCMRHPHDAADDVQALLLAVGRAWCAGRAPDWAKVRGPAGRRRLSLPTYAFDHQRYWLEPGSGKAAPGADTSLTRVPSLDDWFHRRSWSLVPLLPAASTGSMRCLLLLDDDGPGPALAAALQAAGHEVAVVERGAQFAAHGRHYHVNPDEKADYEALWADLTASGFVPDHIVHLWLARGRRASATGGAAVEESQVLGFYSLLLLAQVLLEADVERPLRLTVVTAGAQRVFDEPAAHPEHATVLGPVLVLPRELPAVSARCVDIGTPPMHRGRFDERGAGRELVARLAAELDAPVNERLVALRAIGRFVQRVEPFAVPPARRLPVLRSGAAYLITGGLGGIGLQVARALSASFAEVQLALLSRGGLPPRAEWDGLLGADADNPLGQAMRTVRELEAGGARVLVVRGDVGDRDGLRRAVEEVRARLGPIRGVVHAAGTVADGLISGKQPLIAERVLAPKVVGTLNLEAALAGDELDFFVAFSSTSAVLGLPGQVDYTAANAFLDAFAAARAEPDGPLYTALAWGVWAEVGMAAQSVRAAAPAARPTGHQWLGACVADTPQGVRFEARYAARELWLLDEHRIKGGHALVPGTGYLELARAALHRGGPGTSLEVRELTFIAPLQVPDDAPTDVRIELSRGGPELGLSVQARAAGEAEWRECATGRLGFGDGQAPPAIDVAAIRGRCRVAEQVFAPYAQETRQERHLDFGPRWKVLRRLELGTREAIATLELGRDYAGDVTAIPLHPALLDLACHSGLPLIPGYEACDDLFVPLAFRRVRVSGRLPAQIVSWVRLARPVTASDELVAFDVTIATPAGAVLVEVEHFMVRRLRDRAAISARRPATVTDEVATAARAAGEDDLLNIALRHGIRPAEGIEALRRVLGHRLSPHVLVTPLRLPALLDRVERMATPRPPGARFTRPELAATFTAPRNALEAKVAELWQELLGVDRIGVDDDFFQLGGQSLIAVRLFARVRKLWGVDVPLATLFEAPTVAALAGVIAAEAGLDPQALDTGGRPGAPQRRQRGWSTLVPIQTKGLKRAFYCAAGQGGNAMNLRHLAVHLGDDQPFYGLQARGVDGRLRPHDTVEAMAREYIEDIKRFQPVGPYLLGGYSGGGTVAFEMARQLTAAGEQVEALVFLDSYSRAMPTRTPLERLRVHLRRLLSQGPGYAFEKLRQRIVLHDLAILRRLLLRPFARWFPQRLRADSMVWSWGEAFMRYEPRPWDGTAHLFRVRLDEESQWTGVKMEDDLGWRSLVRELVVTEVPGDHNSMCQEPHVRVLADHLRACLDAAHARIEAAAAGPRQATAPEPAPQSAAS